MVIILLCLLLINKDIVPLVRVGSEVTTTRARIFLKNGIKTPHDIVAGKTIDSLDLVCTVVYINTFKTVHANILASYIHTYIHTYVIHTYNHTYIHTYIHTHRYICTHCQSYLLYIHTYIHTYVYTAGLQTIAQCLMDGLPYYGRDVIDITSYRDEEKDCIDSEEKAAFKACSITQCIKPSSKIACERLAHKIIFR